MAFNEENAVKVEEPVGSVSLEEEDRNEVEERSDVDRKQDIQKRLNAISDSVSFHSGFLQRLMERSIMAQKQDGVTEFIWVEKSEATQHEENKREVEPDNEREHSSEAENSNDVILQDSTENKILDALNLENCTEDTVTASPDFQENVKNPKPTFDIETAENSTNHVAKYIERPFKLINEQYTYDFNLDTMLYHAVRKFNIAKIINEEVLRVMPGNFNALWNKVKLMIAMAEEAGDRIDETAEEILDELEQAVSHKGKQMLIAKAEIAAMYTAFPVTSDLLIRCIRLYEGVLDETNLLSQNECSEPLPENLLVYWKYDLVKMHAMLTNANKKLLAKYGYNHAVVLSRLEELVLAVDSSDHIANKLKAQTWVNLANTFEHFKQYYPTVGLKRDFRSGFSLVNFLAKARKYDPDNPRILMRSGRELRQRATSVQELNEAVDLFKRALKGEDIEDIRDIIYHHMGLTYKALWMRTEHPVCEKIIEDAYKFTSNDLLPVTTHIRTSFGCRVIKPPVHQFDVDLIPPPYKKPPRIAIWKILIPTAPNSEHPYLLEAIKCFEIANGPEKDNSYSLYLLDIARAYSSARNLEKAREYFQKTLNNPGSESDAADFVGVSLFENLAHFEECEMIRKAFRNFKSQYTQDTHRNVDSDSVAEDLVDVSLFEMIRRAFTDFKSEKVKSLYRESIRFSTISKTKTFVAFHHLLRILYKQLTLSVNNPLRKVDQMILQNEYFLLYMAIHEAEDARDIVNCVATDDFKIALMWRLIEMFNRRNQQYDAAAAFTYLSILAIAKKLTTEVKGINFTAIEKQRMLLQAAERVAQQRVTAAETRYLLPEYKEFYDLQGSGEENTSFGSEQLTDLEIKKLEVVKNIMQPEFEPGYQRRYEKC